MVTGDTIVAISSAVGAAARMIVRMSGPAAHHIARLLIVDAGESSPIQFTAIRFSDLEFRSWIYWFYAPASQTGEDVVEFHLPGNPLLARMLLDELIRNGARQAEPGEFTARAYFNGQIDLSQAEGVAASIAASSDAELRAARQLLAGELARRLRPMLDSLADTLALVEVGIDFSEEHVEFLSPNELNSRLDTVRDSLQTLVQDSSRLERLSHMPQVVLVGRPNAGKSTLLNALAGHYRAVVSPESGTTRDVLSAEVALLRGTVQMIDVAGIEENQADPAADRSRRANIANEMQQRAQRALETADFAVLVHDCTDEGPELMLSRQPDLTVFSKADVSHGRKNGNLVSAQTGANMDELRRRLDHMVFGSSTVGTLALNARHVQLIQEAQGALERAGRAGDGAEIVAADLREAIDSLGAVLGKVVPDEILGRIFSSFCIGK